MSDVARIVIESASWTRVQLLLTARIDLEGASPADPAFFFEDCRTSERAPVHHVRREGDRLLLRIDVVQACGGRPFATGEWALFAGDIEGTDGVPVAMDDGFSNDPFGRGGLFEAGGVRYWVVPVCEDADCQFALAVNYRGRRGARHRGWARIRTLPRRLLRAARSRGYVATYRATRKLVRRNGRRILFTSDSRDVLSGNLRYVYRRMLERGLDQEYELRMIFKPSITAKRRVVDKFRFPIYLGMADVVLMDDYQPMIYKVEFPEDVKVVQLWHASGAFKTVGYSRVGKPGGPKPYSTTHRIYTDAIVSSEHDVPFYAEAFGIPEEQVHPTGIPRMDPFFDDAMLEEAQARAHDAFPVTSGKKTILFAPTFRGTGPKTAYYDFDRLDLSALYDVCVEQDTIVLFKMHPFVHDRMDIPEAYRDRMVDATTHREINDLLTVADLVVTDYSSLVFEYSTLGRPMIFYAYDLEDYEATRDFYTPLEEFVPGKIVRTFPELIEALRSGDFEQHKVEDFARRHFDHQDAGSTDRVIDQIVLG